MEFFGQLWLPIVLSAALAWLASSILHMVLPHHKSEYKGLQDEEAVMSALKGAAPGQYMFPWCDDMSKMKDPAFMERTKNNPNGTVTVWPGPVDMGRNLELSFLFYLVVGAFVAYVSWQSRAQMVDHADVYWITGAVAFVAHGLGWIPHMIWFRSKGFWAYTMDAIVLAVLTGGAFAWLWPL